jgi:hypothetical protein
MTVEGVHPPLGGAENEGGFTPYPPSDAAQTGALAVALADGFRNMGGGDVDVSHPANWSLGAWVLYATEVVKLYAHPEDAPRGITTLNPETLELCKQAIASLEARKGEDIDAWAERIARDVVPEDALESPVPPGGPWEICHHYEAGSAVPDQFDVTQHCGLDTVSATKAFTWAEAIAVRDALNREVRDRKGETARGF